MKREIWLDYLRAFACILVTLGHLFNSFIDAHLVNNNSILSIFVQIIYHFHVYIFFFCSGYLFQASFCQLDAKVSWYKKFNRCLDLAVPYVVFSFVTYFIKVLLAEDVNTPVNQSFIHILFNAPINQMWYLYALIIITIVTPVIRSEKTLYIMLAVSIIFKVFSLYTNIYMPKIVRYLLENEIWYALGILFYTKAISIKKAFTVILTFLFTFLCFVELHLGISHPLLYPFMTLTGILASVGIIHNITIKKDKASPVWYYLSKYMLQIYLLHTICAAGIRIILLRININNLLIHILFGLIFSFAIPILCGRIAERTKFLNIVFFPTKTWNAFIEHKKSN